MQIMQNVARRYGLVCLLHEKPFAGVNGSGKHNNWSMATDTGVNLLEPGDTPSENLQFLFFCAAVIQAVNKHQALLRASIACRARITAWAQTRRRRRSSRSSSAQSSKRSSRRSRSGKTERSKPGSFLGLGTPVLPPMPLHGGDRNRTSPFAFTGNKFEFRALGSIDVSCAAEHCAEHDRRRGHRRALGQAQDGDESSGATLEKAVTRVVKDAWNANKQIVFDGDNYSGLGTKRRRSAASTTSARPPTRCPG